jgi:hypothetical protein
MIMGEVASQRFFQVGESVKLAYVDQDHLISILKNQSGKTLQTVRTWS